FLFPSLFSWCSHGSKNIHNRFLYHPLVLESPVRSSYLVPRGSNQDRDRLGSVPKPKIT
ncbi:hypothetical protein BYT27DRAFT_7079637, partial [Phlegmacium glaucopus]